MNLLEKLKKGLSKSRYQIRGSITSLINRTKKISEETWGDLEEILVQADVGVETTLKLIQSLREKRVSKENLLAELKEEILKDLDNQNSLELKEGLNILLIVGVNGTGKTTSIAKISYLYKKRGKKVILAAADTFRAAAIEQLEEWAKKIEVDLVKHQRGGSPAAVVYDAVEAASKRDADLLIIDTAGRLHTYSHLIEELKKIKRVILKLSPQANLKILLVLDATFGENALSQAKTFQEGLGLDGIILTKMDGTAKGGIVIPLRKKLGIPINFLGIGENLEDLVSFEAKAFIEALFS